MILITMSSPEERPYYKEPSSPVGMTQLGLVALFVTPSAKKMMETAIDSLMTNLSSTRGSHQARNNGEHMLIPVMAKMIHSAVWDSERFVLKDGQLLQMVKLVGAVRNFCVHIKHVQIDVEDKTGLVRVILWREKKNAWHSIT